MTSINDPASVRGAFLEVLSSVVPGVSGAAITDDVDLREALELDSMDVLRLLVKVKERFGAEVPAVETSQFFTTAGAVAWLCTHAARS
jgi:acyl carrier protein